MALRRPGGPGGDRDRRGGDRASSGSWLDRYPGPGDPDHVVTLNAYYHATADPGAEVGEPDPAETSEIGWFAPDDLPPVAFPDHAEAVLAAWREAVRDGRTVTPLPDRPGPRR